MAATALVMIGCQQTTPVEDTAPTFPTRAAVRDQTYVAGTAIGERILPVAAGGNGALTYSLGPQIPPGLVFDAEARVLSGTPTTTGTYEMIYTAMDSDDNA